MAEEDPALTGQLALETGGNLATIATNTTGVATATNQTTGNTSLSSIATNTGASATSANQTTELASLSTIATNTGKIPSVGQTTMSASQPVVIASNQSTVPVSLATNTPTLQSGSTTAVTQATASNLNAQVVGNVPAAGADSGNGVKISGVYNTTLPTYTNGQRADLQTTANGSLQSNLNTLIAGEDLTNNVLRTNIYGGLMPLGTLLNTYEAQLTTNATTAVTASTAYISSIVIAVPTAGTTSTLTIQDGQGTPLKLVNALSTATAITGAPATYDFSTPIKMTSGISVVTAGAAAATNNVWINYYQ